MLARQQNAYLQSMAAQSRACREEQTGEGCSNRDTALDQELDNSNPNSRISARTTRSVTRRSQTERADCQNGKNCREQALADLKATATASTSTSDDGG